MSGSWSTARCLHNGAVIGGAIVLSLALAGCAGRDGPSSPDNEATTTSRSAATTSTTVTTTTVRDTLHSIFPQAGDGEAFDFREKGGVLDAEFDDKDDCHRTDHPFGLRLKWRMRGAGFGGWGVLWTGSPTRSFDASSFTSLIISVKGAKGGETFQVGLKDTLSPPTEWKIESRTRTVVSGKEWLSLNVKLSAFRGVDLTSLDNVNIGWNKNHRSGEICIDQIELRA